MTLKLQRSLGERNQENNIIILTRFINKNTIFLLFILHAVTCRIDSALHFFLLQTRNYKFNYCNDLHKEQLFFIQVSADLSHVSLITRHKFNNSGLDRYVHFTSLEMMKNNNYHMMVIIAIPSDNFAVVSFGKFSRIGSNFGEYEDSMNSQLQ